MNKKQGADNSTFFPVESGFWLPLALPKAPRQILKSLSLPFAFGSNAKSDKCHVSNF